MTSIAPEIKFDFCSDQQEEFVADQHTPEVLYSGAVRAGKSYALALKSMTTAFQYPGRYCIVTRKNFSSIGESTLRAFRDLFPTDWYSYNDTQHIWTWFNGSKDYFVGCDTFDRIKSAQADLVLVDQAEEITDEAWNWLLTRLNVNKMPRGQMAAACNPEHKGHWLYQRFFVQGRGKYFHTRTLDNRFLPEDYKERLNEFVGKFRERFVEGRWIGFEGLVYEIFDPEVHVIDPFPIPDSWAIYGACDFGYTNPFSFLAGAVDKDGEKSPPGSIHVYKEIYKTRTLVEDLAKEVKQLEPRRFRAVWADHDAEDRATMHRHGVITRNALKDVKTGIEEVYKMLAPKPYKGGGDDLKPTIYFHRGMLKKKDFHLTMGKRPACTVDEFPQYLYEIPIDGRMVKEMPQKVNDHGMDAVRYLVMGILKHSIRPFAFV